MISLEQIQNRISEAIRQSGMTQNDIAQKLGIKQSQISCYVHGKKMPTISTLANLLAIIDADPYDILCIDEYNKPEN